MIKLLFSSFLLFLAFSEISTETIQVEGIVECCDEPPTPTRPKRGGIVKDFLGVGEAPNRHDKKSVRRDPDHQRFRRFPNFLFGKFSDSNNVEEPKATLDNGCVGQAGAKIELWETDSTLPGDKDDFLNTTLTSKNGRFQIQGSESEFATVPEFYLKLSHSCGLSEADINQGCKKTIIKKIPIEKNDKNLKLYNWRLFKNEGEKDSFKEC